MGLSKRYNLISKFRVQYNTKKYEPYTITTQNAENTIKAAVKDKDETLYINIKDLDLIAKEFKVHSHCYQQYTNGYAFGSRSSTSSSVQDMATNNCYNCGNFEQVKEYVEDKVLGLGNAVSMNILHEIYGLEVGDNRYRNKLKVRLKDDFKEKISFVAVSHETAEVVIPSYFLDGAFLNDSRVTTIKNAAKYLREEIKNTFKSLPEVKWPPSIQELSDSSRSLPRSIYAFLETLINEGNHLSVPLPNISRVIDSIVQDIASAVTRGKYMQQKHFLLGQGLHNHTGSRKVIDIVYKLGHCNSYNTVCEIETAQAECALIAAKRTSIIELTP